MHNFVYLAQRRSQEFSCEPNFRRGACPPPRLLRHWRRQQLWIRYLLLGSDRPQQQTRRPPLLLSIDGTDRLIDWWTDTRPFYDAVYRILCRPRNKQNSRSLLSYLLTYLLTARRCPHSMLGRVYVTVGRPSVRLSHQAAARRCRGFAAVGRRAGDVD